MLIPALAPMKYWLPDEPIDRMRSRSVLARTVALHSSHGVRNTRKWLASSIPSLRSDPSVPGGGPPKPIVEKSYSRDASARYAVSANRARSVIAKSAPISPSLTCSVGGANIGTVALMLGALTHRGNPSDQLFASPYAARKRSESTCSARPSSHDRSPLLKKCRGRPPDHRSQRAPAPNSTRSFHASSCRTALPAIRAPMPSPANEKMSGLAVSPSVSCAIIFDRSWSYVTSVLVRSDG